MDRLKKDRRLLRTAVTKLVGSLDTELKKDTPNRIQLGSIQEVLEEQCRKLNEVDESIKDKMLEDDKITDQILEDDMFAVQDYCLKVSEVKARANEVLNPPMIPRGTHSFSSTVTDHSSDRHNKKNIKYPKIELKKYGGDLKDWLGWWAQFEKIHLDEDLDDADKFTYLVQCMEKVSRAEELVRGYPQSRSNYAKAIDALKSCYGRPKLLKQVYVRELISMILLKTREKLGLTSLYDRLESYLRSLESLGVTAEQMGIFLFPMVESSLSEEILLARQRSPNFGMDAPTQDPPKTELDFLMDFLKKEIDNEEQRTLALRRSSEESKTKRVP